MFGCCQYWSDNFYTNKDNQRAIKEFWNVLMLFRFSVLINKIKYKHSRFTEKILSWKKNLSNGTMIFTTYNDKMTCIYRNYVINNIRFNLLMIKYTWILTSIIMTLFHSVYRIIGEVYWRLLKLLRIYLLSSTILRFENRRQHITSQQ